MDKISKQIHTVAKIRQLTKDNNHTEAVRQIIIYAKDVKKDSTVTKRLLKAIEAVQVLHDFHGHMTIELQNMRTDLLIQVKLLLSEQEKAAFERVL